MSCSKTDSFRLEEYISSSVERQHIFNDFLLGSIMIVLLHIDFCWSSAPEWFMRLGHPAGEPNQGFHSLVFVKSLWMSQIYLWTAFLQQSSVLLIYFCTSVSQSTTQVSMAVLMYFRLIPNVLGSLKISQESILSF